MKKIFCSGLFLLISVFVYGQSSSIIVKDSISNFKGDLPVGFFQLKNGNKLLRIKSGDSTFLYKEYSKNKNLLFDSHQTDLNGIRNGYFYYLDTINFNKTNGVYLKGKLIESYTVSPHLDTIRYTRKINDTLFNCMEIKAGEKQMWQLNSNSIYNGYFKIINTTTNKITLEGNYLAIKESEIVDKKKYAALLKKYKITNTWRGEDNGREIPVGVWHTYNENGKLIKTIKYNWEGVFIK